MLYQLGNSDSMNNGDLNNYQLGDANIIYDYTMMNKTKDQIASETGVWKGTVNSLIKRINILKEVLSRVGQFPHWVSSLKWKLLNNFKELKEISDSTIRRNLRNKLNMSFKRMIVMNPKSLIPESFSKMIQSASLLKILSDFGVELIFIDEFSISSRSSKVYGLAERGKKALISQYCGSVSISVITALSSNRYYPSFIK